jgi:hypothetical protein
MLTGPVTMLQWSFVRDDQPREQARRRLALAARDEASTDRKSRRGEGALVGAPGRDATRGRPIGACRTVRSRARRAAPRGVHDYPTDPPSCACYHAS